MVIILLVLAGLCFGSFINALVWRLHQQQNGKSPYKISTGRSVCPNCGHQLAAKDLVPVLSWLVLRGRCRYCRTPIAKQYPAVEILTAIVFAASFIFWPEPVAASGQWLLLGTWLASSIGLIALAIYDWRYTVLPNHIIYPTLAIAAVGQGAYTVLYATTPLRYLILWMASIVVASGFFLLIFIVSRGQWIGYGDVRLGLITGTLLAGPVKSMAMLFFASLAGTVVALPGLISGRKNLTHRLPFGPFLIGATGFVLLFGQPILDWYKRLIGA